MASIEACSCHTTLSIAFNYYCSPDVLGFCHWQAICSLRHPSYQDGMEFLFSSGGGIISLGHRVLLVLKFADLHDTVLPGSFALLSLF